MQFTCEEKRRWPWMLLTAGAAVLSLCHRLGFFLLACQLFSNIGVFDVFVCLARRPIHETSMPSCFGTRYFLYSCRASLRGFWMQLEDPWYWGTALLTGFAGWSLHRDSSVTCGPCDCTSAVAAATTSWSTLLLLPLLGFLAGGLAAGLALQRFGRQAIQTVTVDNRSVSAPLDAFASPKRLKDGRRPPDA